MLFCIAEVPEDSVRESEFVAVFDIFRFYTYGICGLAISDICISDISRSMLFFCIAEVPADSVRES